MVLSFGWKMKDDLLKKKFFENDIFSMIIKDDIPFYCKFNITFHSKNNSLLNGFSVSHESILAKKIRKTAGQR